MDPDLHLHHNHHQQQQPQMNSGLTRYRSAPSSYFSNLINNRDGIGSYGGEDLEQFLNPARALSPETEVIFRRFMSSTEAGNLSSYNQSHIARENKNNNSPVKNTAPEIHHQQQQIAPMQQTGSQLIYQSNSQKNQSSLAPNSLTDDSFALIGSIQSEMKIGAGVSNSTLVRHSSSPAGLFSHIHVQDGRMRNQMEYSLGLSQISETEGRSLGISGSEDANLSETRRNSVSGGEFIAGFSIGSWNDSAGAIMQECQSNESGKRAPTMLSHHLSLPNSSSEISAAMENLVQFQEMVPCQMRAKRGCATHPRSIAERVRRTKISERIRKLQELVPNMDKQTNTSDMLDLAADYIKELQRQVKALSENRAKCKCSNKQIP